MTSRLQLSIRETDGRIQAIDLAVDQVLLVGYSGRDRDAVREHIRELELLGVRPPERVPAIYTVAPELLTTASRLPVDSPETSGEAEFVLLDSADGWLVGVGSDHTDRRCEAIDVAASKSRCGKVLSHDLWRLAAVEAHWDALELRAWTTDGSGRRLYQDSRLETLLTVPQLTALVEQRGFATERGLIFGGTLPTIGGFVFGSHFEVELRDPVLDRQLGCAYRVVVSSTGPGAPI